MYEYTHIIQLRETDATGILYFTELLNIAQVVFESYLYENDVSIQKMIEDGEFLMPIVHAEADYTAALRVGDQVDIQLFAEKIGTSSFTLKTIFECRDKQAGTAQIVHVAISRKTGESISLPEEILELLSPIKFDQLS